MALYSSTLHLEGRSSTSTKDGAYEQVSGVYLLRFEDLDRIGIPVCRGSPSIVTTGLLRRLVSCDEKGNTSCLACRKVSRRGEHHCSTQNVTEPSVIVAMIMILLLRTPLLLLLRLLDQLQHVLTVTACSPIGLLSIPIHSFQPHLRQSTGQSKEIGYINIGIVHVEDSHYGPQPTIQDGGQGKGKGNGNGRLCLDHRPNGGQGRSKHGDTKEDTNVSNVGGRIGQG